MKETMWLTLNYNQLTGRVPSELGQLTNAAKVWLYRTHLRVYSFRGGKLATNIYDRSWALSHGPAKEGPSHRIWSAVFLGNPPPRKLDSRACARELKAFHSPSSG
jgi:hypothetical protein